MRSRRGSVAAGMPTNGFLRISSRRSWRAMARIDQRVGRQGEQVPMDGSSSGHACFHPESPSGRHSPETARLRRRPPRARPVGRGIRRVPENVPASRGPRASSRPIPGGRRLRSTRSAGGLTMWKPNGAERFRSASVNFGASSRPMINSQLGPALLAVSVAGNVIAVTVRVENGDRCQIVAGDDLFDLVGFQPRVQNHALPAALQKNHVRVFRRTVPIRRIPHTVAVDSPDGLPRCWITGRMGKPAGRPQTSTVV